MRLYTIYKLCDENIVDLLNCQMHYSYENSVAILNVERWNKAREALNNLYTIKAFEEIIMEIYRGVPVIYRDEDNWKVASSKTQFKVNLEKFINKIQGIIEVYESFGYDAGEIGIDIKMPIGDFVDFTTNIKMLEYIFYQCPLLKRDDSEIKFGNVDVGSTWLIFFVVGTGATILAKNIAAIIDKAIVIKSHWMQTKEQEEQLRTLGLANDVLETTINSFKVLNEAYMNKALDELEEECMEYNDGEERDKTQLALEKMIDLLDKGMEIYSSINTPKEIQTLFPTLETERFIENKETKLLETTAEE